MVVFIIVKCERSSVYSSWQRPCMFIELRAVVECYLVQTAFIFGINLLVAVSTTLCSV